MANVLYANQYRALDLFDKKLRFGRDKKELEEIVDIVMERIT